MSRHSKNLIINAAIFNLAMVVLLCFSYYKFSGDSPLMILLSSLFSVTIVNIFSLLSFLGAEKNFKALRNKVKSSGLSIEELSKHTNIPIDKLEALYYKDFSFTRKELLEINKVLNEN